MTNFYIPKTKKIVLAGLLIAIFVLLDRVFTINMQILKINLSLVIVAVAAILLGPKYSILVGAARGFNRFFDHAFRSIFPGVYT